MKKITTIAPVLFITVILLFTSCTSDGTFDFSSSGGGGSGGPYFTALDSAIATEWFAEDSSQWYESHNESGKKMIFCTPDINTRYSNSIKLFGYVKRLDTTDIAHSMSYTLGDYKISLVNASGQEQLQITNIANDVYPDPAEIADLLQFRVFIIPVEQWSASLSVYHYDEICAYYNIGP
ncbi:hypothetical protein FRZ67_13330 [Panacibacter ginsenosidivorans]|uniref:Uncharacterized protein n=1 Tax=Panacibacter ginsenosidivorans TaxID=1813871 RepID=A0A5B8VBD7_9BACT|nr:hypothetical protein [Panacibacter ginsenosidivorans]QEC68231.1 hypothetical protein FRZ67_13330 [Panacibacter ginsenosidivorans]